jgi:hypothetical protein
MAQFLALFFGGDGGGQLRRTLWCCGVYVAGKTAARVDGDKRCWLAAGTVVAVAVGQRRQVRRCLVGLTYLTAGQ